MSTYITSDLHGDFKRFRKLLNTIRFDCNSDVIYVLGDVLDRGADGIALLDFIRSYSELKTQPMRLIKGNHELFAQMYLEGTLSMKQWSAWGGQQTIEQILQLTVGEREDGSCEIIIEDNYMCVDSGAGHRHMGGKMSIYRIEDGKVFYI